MSTPPGAARLRALSPAPMCHERTIPERGLFLGRDPGRADLLLATATVSRRHCWIGQDGESGWLLCDLDSTNGVFVDGRRVEGQFRLRSGMVLGLGNAEIPDFEFMVGDDSQREIVLPPKTRWLVGRSLQADISLPADPTVSERHCEIIARDGELHITDLGSLNGTRLQGRRIRHQRLEEMTPVAVGNTRLSVRAIAGNRYCVTVDGRTPGLRVQLVGLCLRAPLLENLDLVIQPGELVGISVANERLAGRLLTIIAGRQLADAGTVLFNDLPPSHAHRYEDTRVGLVHRDVRARDPLTLGEHMRYIAGIRLPADIDAARRDSLIATTLIELELEPHAQRRLQDLAEPQQRLAAIAAELVTRPHLLCLEAPFTGLDDDQARRLLDCLRRLARSGTGVVIAGCHLPARNTLDRYLRIGADGRPAGRSQDPPPAFSERARLLSAAPGSRLTRTDPGKTPAIGSLHRLVVSVRRRCRIRLTRPVSLVLAAVSACLLGLAAGAWHAAGASPAAALALAVAAAAVLNALPETLADRNWLERELRGSLRPAEDLLARFGCALLIAAAQAVAILAIFNLTADSTAMLTPGIGAALALVAASATALGLMIGAIDTPRGGYTLLMLPAVFALQWLVLEVPAPGNELSGWLYLRLRDLLPGYWGTLLADGPGSLAETLRASAFLAGQTITWLAIARTLHARRYRLR